MEITWNEHGMPTVEAVDELEACYGYGYCQAVAHATEILELYGRARGGAAALWGEAFLEADVEHARFGLGEHVDIWWAAQEAPTRARLRAFCDGFNAACAEVPTRGGPRREALPVRARDVVAHVVGFFFGFARFWDQGLAFPPAGGAGLLGGGSSAWAVHAQRSREGDALLMINPHIPWSGPYRLFEARTVSPGRTCHGVTPIGFPWQSFAYGPRAGWTHTVNPVPQLWVYELDVTEGRYRYDGGTLPLERHRHVIEVRGGAAVIVEERRSVHGPVITAPDGAEVAIRVAGVLHEPATTALEGWWQMSLAGTVHELLAAQDQWPLPIFNIIAADAEGSIAAAFCGAAPVRPGGCFEDSLRRLPGDDPAHIWHELNPPASLPRVIDPPCGWVQNVNETPWWFCEPPLEPAQHPDGIAPESHRIRDIRSPLSRARMSTRSVVAAQDLLELKWQTRVHLADIVLDDLLAACRQEHDLGAAAEALRDWDRHADPGSRGYPLFHLWAHEHFPVGEVVMGDARLIPAAEPGGLPRGLVDPAGAVASLRRAVARLAQLGRAPEARYGDAARLGSGDEAVPASGGPTYFGVFKCLELLPGPGTWDAVGGDTWVCLVRFGAEGAEASSLLLPGRSTEPDAPPQRSQAPLFAAEELRPHAPMARSRSHRS